MPSSPEPRKRSKSGWVSRKSRTVALSRGGGGAGASHFCHFPSKHVSLPTPQSVEHCRIATGTSHVLHVPAAQVREPRPQSLVHDEVATGTSQVLQLLAAHLSVP